MHTRTVDTKSLILPLDHEYWIQPKRVFPQRKFYVMTDHKMGLRVYIMQAKKKRALELNTTGKLKLKGRRLKYG